MVMYYCRYKFVWGLIYFLTREKFSVFLQIFLCVSLFLSTWEIKGTFAVAKAKTNKSNSIYKDLHFFQISSGSSLSFLFSLANKSYVCVNKKKVEITKMSQYLFLMFCLLPQDRRQAWDWLFFFFEYRRLLVAQLA